MNESQQQATVQALLEEIAVLNNMLAERKMQLDNLDTLWLRYVRSFPITSKSSASLRINESLQELRRKIGFVSSPLREA